MSDDNIQVSPNRYLDPTPGQIIPMQVGNAIVYIQQFRESNLIEPEDRIFTVSLPSPKDAFQSAMEVIKETVAGMGSKLDELKEKMRPDKLVVEFSIGFELKGKVNIIPVLVSSEGSVNSGLKITAEWNLGKDKSV